MSHDRSPVVGTIIIYTFTVIFGRRNLRWVHDPFLLSFLGEKHAIELFKHIQTFWNLQTWLDLQTYSDFTNIRAFKPCQTFIKHLSCWAWSNIYQTFKLLSLGKHYQTFKLLSLDKRLQTLSEHLENKLWESWESISSDYERIRLHMLHYITSLLSASSKSF